MQKIIISDTSCLILFEKIGELNLIHDVFGEIIVTQEIAREYGLTLPKWISIQDPIDLKFQKSLETKIDRGEASAIALAVELANCLLIIDDQKGRKLAVELGVEITGTFGIILEAKVEGKIDSVKPILARIKQTDFRISEELEFQILELAGEN